MTEQSSAATTRIGRLVNARYRQVTSSLGIKSRDVLDVSGSTTIGSTLITFTGIEQIRRVRDGRDLTAVKVLKEVTLDELQNENADEGDEPTRWAVYRVGASSVTIKLDAQAETEYSLLADGLENASTLSGSTAPAFPESFHDILVEGATADELKRKEKLVLAKDAEAKFERRLSQLRLHLALSPGRTTRQGEREATSGTLGSGGGSAVVGGQSYVQTGLITFDRDPSAPFAVSSGSAKVDNLDADLLDGLNSTAFGLVASPLSQFAATTSAQLAGVISDETGSGALVFATSPTLVTPALGTPASGTLTNCTGLPVSTGVAGLGSGVATFLATPSSANLASVLTDETGTGLAVFGTKPTITFANTGLTVRDTGDDHLLSIVPGSNLTADHTLTLTTGDADRTITLSGNPTLSDWFDQSVKAAASPTFVGLTLSGAVATATTVSQSDDHIFTANKAIRRSTSDASDNGYIIVTGGGADATDGSRGALIAVAGNEEGTRFGNGVMQFRLGNVAGSKMQFRSGDNNTTYLELTSTTVTSPAITATTTATAANMVIESDVVKRSTSSARYKTNVEDLDYGLAEILQLRPVYFNDVQTPDGWTHCGFIAEEMNKVMPNLVGYEKVNGEKVPGWIEYDYMTAPIVKAIQELAVRVAALEG